MVLNRIWLNRSPALALAIPELSGKKQIVSQTLQDRFCKDCQEPGNEKEIIVIGERNDVKPGKSSKKFGYKSSRSFQG